MPLAIDRGLSARYSGLRPRGVTHSSRMTGAEGPRAWTGSWTGAPDNSSVVSAAGAMIRVIYAASTLGAWGRSSHNPPVVGSSPTRPTAVSPE